MDGFEVSQYTIPGGIMGDEIYTILYGFPGLDNPPIDLPITGVAQRLRFIQCDQVPTVQRILTRKIDQSPQYGQTVSLIGTPKGGEDFRTEKLITERGTSKIQSASMVGDPPPGIMIIGETGSV